MKERIRFFFRTSNYDGKKAAKCEKSQTLGECQRLWRNPGFLFRRLWNFVSANLPFYRHLLTTQPLCNLVYSLRTGWNRSKMHLFKICSEGRQDVGRQTKSHVINRCPATKCEMEMFKKRNPSETRIRTCEVTWESGTGSWSHRLVLQALSELRRPLHLALQRLQSIHCFWGQWWFWDKWKKDREDIRNYRTAIRRNTTIKKCLTLSRAGGTCAAVAFRQQSHSLQG